MELNMNNVGKTIINNPPVITIFIGGITLPFPVMGGKHDIVLPTYVVKLYMIYIPSNSRNIH